MKNKQKKYAEILLKECLKLDKGQPLLIIGEVEFYEFIRIIADVAMEIGVTDIGFSLTDPHIKHSMLLNLEEKDLKNHPYFEKSLYNEYAKKDAAFLMLTSEHPDLMSDIDAKKINNMQIYTMETRKYLDERRDKNEIAWCIAMVPTQEWADKVYPKDENNLEHLWNTIFNICSINKREPVQHLQELIKSNQNIANKLNDLKIKELHYQNELGTDFTIGLSEQSRWATGVTHLASGKDVVVNFPSLEVFTSPDKFTANGLVYSTMPLLAAGVVIEDFSLEFQDGKITNVTAKKNEDLLKEMINSVPNANYLGELALVPYDSAIRNQETLFYTTLLDENASCHMAFGSGFTECLEGSVNATDKEKERMGLNTCRTHTDFMIGSQDLSITATTFDGEEIVIFEKGNFSKYFKN